MERAKPSSMQSPGSGECSKFVETSLGASHDMRFPAVDASTLRKEANQTAKQYDSDDFSPGNDHANRENDTQDDIASEKPEVEAYWKGSWWDVGILQMDLDKCYVHYKNFHYNDDQWVPMNHLRMRSRASEFSDCRRIVPRMDVCVMVRHPHSDTESPAWYDARIIDLERKPHPPEICKCWFWIALYTIPEILQSDISQRECLPVKSDAVALTEMSIMTEARNMSFHEILAASLPSVTNSPRIWAKDGSHWYSSLNHISRSEEKNFYFENRGAGDSLGLPFSQGHREKSVSPQLLPFDAFVEEEGLLLEQTSESPDVNIDEDDDIIVISSDSEEQPTVLDVDVESDASCEITQMNDRGIMYLDRYASDDSNVWELNPERVEDFRDNPNSTLNLESLGNSDEDQAEMIVSDLHSLKLAERSPSKTTFVTPDKSSPSPCDQIVPLVQGTVQPSEPAASSEDSEADFAKHPEQYIGFPEIVSTDEPAKSFENSDADEFADYTERNIVRNVSDQQPVPENYTAAAKRKVAEEHVTKGKTAVNPIVKRRRLNSDVKFSFQGICNKGGLKTKPSHFTVQQHIERLSSKNTAKEKSTIYPSKNVDTLGATLASFPVTGGRILDEIASTGLEEYADELEGLLLDASLDMTEPKLVAYSKEALKTGCAPQVVKEKSSKKNAREIAAVRRRPVEKEITYSDLFDCVKLVQPNIQSQEKGPSEDFTWVPQFNPLFKFAGAVPQEMKVDPLADVWEAMRVAEESVKKVNEWTKEAVHEGTNFVGICEHPDGSVHSEHGTLKFDQEVGEVCEVCGIIVTNIKDMWARDNAKRIAGKQEGNDGSDVDMYGFDEDMDTLASWNPDDENHKQQKNIERDSNFELIPDLAKHMQRHQKQGFQFLWRNLDGQGSNGNHCFEKGGCVLSHAPGTGKTFLIISFLHSYMKKYPETRPIILAPKIMLQPWMKEFTKWNVDIPVYNFNQSDEQGRALLQQHEDTGRIRLNRIGRSQRKKRLLVYREAMIWQWINTQSVLIMSYPMLNNLYKISPSDTRMFKLRTLLLERPTIMILDEGHVIRNKQSQVLKQLNAVKTRLRIMLSGTLFQNNFEELYTCLNVVRPGFVAQFARAAGFKHIIHQEFEPQRYGESEQSARARKEKAYKMAEPHSRKLFIESIGSKIDKGQKSKASSELLAQGLEQLRRLTSPFIHHYTGGNLQNLPPLRDFAVMLQPSALQEKMIQNLEIRLGNTTMLERECLLSFVCIHPTLLSQHNVGKTLTDLLPPEEMNQAASNRDPAVGVKTGFVIDLIKHLRFDQEKILIFCQNLDPLLLLEEMLGKQFDWVRDREILQIDGKVVSDERQSIVERFNDPNGRIRVLLASTKACGEGVTLTGASCVFVMDVLWNPAVIRQAIHRAFRIGQQKIVHVYRLVISGTFEEGKYRRMVWKDHKSQAIFSENQETVVEKNTTSQTGFWEIRKQCSKDLALNELCRQDAELDQPAFKHIFRHGGLFDEDFQDDPEGKGTDATDWLRGIEGVESLDFETDGSSGNDGDGDTEDFDGLDEDV